MKPLIRRRTLTSQVIDHILEQIKSGQVRAGEKLPTEKQLTETLQVSRTCVREAVKSLESLGLVTVRPRVGAVVQEPTPASILNAEQFSEDVDQEQIDKLFEFRMIVEVGLASLAAEQADAGDLAAIEETLERYRRELRDNRAVDCHTDMAFHDALATASKNPLGQSVWRMISARLVEVLQRNAAVPGIYPDTLRDHLKIFRAIKDRDPRKARRVMREHLENADRVTRLALGDVLKQRRSGRNKTRDHS